MASSQIELASSMPFGCVLRDHNRRERCRESNARAAQAAFHNNLKSLVRDHLSTCISSVSSSNPASNESKKPLGQIENVVDSWVENKDESSIMSPRQARVLDRWAARQQGKETERQSQEAELMSLPASAPSSSRASTSVKEETLSRTDSLAEISNLGVGASSLVQIWEKRLNQSNKMCSNGNVTETGRSNSGLSENENIFNSPIESNASNESTASNDPNPSSTGSNLEKQPSRGFETEDSIFDERFDVGPVTEDSFEDSHSDGSVKPGIRSILEAEREREKVRVSDIIKRLTGSQQCTLSSPCEFDNDHDQQQSCVNPSPCKDRDRERHFGFDHAEQLHKAFCHVISSPRMIRGRQAFADLLMHLERDRHRELDTLVDLRAVSKFSQKGRIQSMLKLKMLQRGMSMSRQDSLCRKPATYQEKMPQGSSIMHLREKFISGVEHAQNDAGSPRNHAPKELEKDMRVVRVENSSSANRPRESPSNGKFEIIEQKNTNTTFVQNPLPRAGEDIREEVSLSSDVTLQGTSSVVRESSLLAKASDYASSCSKDTLEGTSLVARNELPETGNDLHDEASSSSSKVTSSLVVKNALTQASKDVHDEASPSSESTLRETSLMAKNTLPQVCEDVCEVMNKNSEEIWHGSNSADRSLELQETADTSTSLVGWDENEIEEEDGYHYYGDYSYDSWINEISRPRSYWEDLRKTWYQEMLNSNSGKGEIRQLIERRTVSNFLTSDFRDKIDRLMVSRMEIQTQQDCGEEEEDEDNTQDRLDQMVAFLQQQQQKQVQQQQQQQQQKNYQGSQEEEKQGLLQEQEQEHQQEEQNMTEEEEEDDDEEDENEDEEEERSLISGQFQEAGDDFDQLTSPSHMTAWSYQDNEVLGDDSDRAASISPPPRRCSPSPSYQHRRQCSSSPSYNQRYRRYSPSTNHPSIEVELIYDMRGQMEKLYHEMSDLRKTIKSCVDMQITMQKSMMKQEVHSGQTETKRDANGVAKKGNCCICREVKVDSLFYRCGHMCTCLKCAQELQWKSGKCPICGSPIVDVVKAYMKY